MEPLEVSLAGGNMLPGSGLSVCSLTPFRGKPDGVMGTGECSGTALAGSVTLEPFLIYTPSLHFIGLFEMIFLEVRMNQQITGNNWCKRRARLNKLTEASQPGACLAREDRREGQADTNQISAALHYWSRSFPVHQLEPVSPHQLSKFTIPGVM